MAEADAIREHVASGDVWDIAPEGAIVSFLTGTSKFHTLARRTGRVVEIVEEVKGRLVFRSYVIEGYGERYNVPSHRVRVIDLTPAAEEDCGPMEVATDESVDAEEAEWAGHVAGLIAAAHERLAPLSGRWAVYRCGGLVDSAGGYAWPWAAGLAKWYAEPAWVNEGDVEVRLDGKRVLWL